MNEQILPTLQTVRDWLRFAVSRFREAKIVLGHGTTREIDEAAFLILSALHLPHDELDPWLDARLTMAERKVLGDVIEKRIVSRKPASYLTHSAWIGPYQFYVDERVIVPRSFLGELLVEGLDGIIDDAMPVDRVLDMCTGSGCLAIIAAHQYPAARVDAADLMETALAVAKRNVTDHGLTDRVTLHQGDLFGAIGNAKYDLILCNPPYVTSDAVAAFPPEYQAEPVEAHDGGKDGMMLVRRILGEAREHLTPHGVLVMEIGMGREIIERDYPELALLWLDTAESEGEVFAVTAASLGAKPTKPKSKKGR